MADDRTYIRVHDGIDENHKIEGLSDAAFRLLISSWAYCSRNLSDGRITEVAWKRRGKPSARRELLSAGLVDERDGYVEMHDYLEHQRSAAQVAELKRKRAEAGSRGGRAKAANALASARQTPEQTPSKNVPSTEAETDTEEPSLEGGSLVGRGNGSQPPLFPDHCADHQIAVPPRCGGCQKQKQANAQQRPLAVVRSNHCLVHDEVFAERCNECEKDKRRATA